MLRLAFIACDGPIPASTYSGFLTMRPVASSGTYGGTSCKRSIETSVLSAVRLLVCPVVVSSWRTLAPALRARDISKLFKRCIRMRFSGGVMSSRPGMARVRIATKGSVLDPATSIIMRGISSSAWSSRSGFADGANSEAPVSASTSSAVVATVGSFASFAAGFAGSCTFSRTVSCTGAARRSSTIFCKSSIAFLPIAFVLSVRRSLPSDARALISV